MVFFKTMFCCFYYNLFFFYYKIYMAPKKNSHGEILFKDYPDFRPNLTPREMFQIRKFWRNLLETYLFRYYKKTL